MAKTEVFWGSGYELRFVLLALFLASVVESESVKCVWILIVLRVPMADKRDDRKRVLADLCAV